MSGMTVGACTSTREKIRNPKHEIRHLIQIRLAEIGEKGRKGEREEGKKGRRKYGGQNGMLLVRICLGPVTVMLPAAAVMDFEFVWDFDIGMSDFGVWWWPRGACGCAMQEGSGLHEEIR